MFRPVRGLGGHLGGFSIGPKKHLVENVEFLIPVKSYGGSRRSTQIPWLATMVKFRQLQLSGFEEVFEKVKS